MSEPATPAAALRRSYDPHGKAHHMLARLEQGPAQTTELRFAALPHKPSAKRRKAHFVICALMDDGLMVRDCAGAYHMTPAGADALTALRAGHPVVFEGGPAFARPGTVLGGQAAQQGAA